MFSKKYGWWLISYLVVSGGADKAALKLGCVYYQTSKKCSTLSISQLEQEKDCIREDLQLQPDTPVQIINFQPIIES